MTSSFLPITHAEALERGWEQLDFVYIIGDAYVDHPSFGAAIISRVIESLGFSIGIISQPVADRDYMEFGKPRYAFLVTGGNIDSMVAHYTAAKRRRSDDAYTPGGKAGRRPDRATIVYSHKLRQLYPDSNIVIGGLEASLRRFAHYDYWDDAVRPSILLDSQADLLLYGMGEKVITQLTQRLRHGEALETIRDLRGCCYLCRQEEIPQDSVSCASFHKVSENKESYAKAHQIQTEWQDAVYGKTIVQKQTDTLYLWCKTRRCLPSPARSWTRCSTCPSPAPITRPMRQWAEWMLSKRWNFPSSKTAAALATATSVPSPSIRADRWFPAASNPSCTRRRR